MSVFLILQDCTDDYKFGFGIRNSQTSQICPNYGQACCKPKPKCGLRNPGLGYIQSYSTKEGEWPHMCILIDTSARGTKYLPGKVVGGASLIAPGIVVTAVHKIE